jgi:predicted lipid-binding transport protein (Tim44 family)
MISSRSRLAAVLAGALALTVVAAAPAEARRGGSFGSRGSRTYVAPRPTATTPGYVPPVQRSMTAPPAGYSPGYGRPTYAPAPAPAYGAGYGARQRFGGLGFGGGLLAGLATGGLVGALMGHGWGGGWGSGLGGGAMAGMGLFATLFQLGLIALLVWLGVRLFRRRNGQPQPAGFPSAYDPGPAYEPGPQPGGPWGAAPGGYPAGPAPAEIAVSAADRAAFERLLIEVQDAFGREDYAGLRERTTPEVMSYLAEELSENATHGRRNEVSRTRLLRSDVSEAWREGDADYATVALNYESVDVMRDRRSGEVVQGDPNAPTATTELWTFVRQGGGPWKLSAIQEV